MYLITRQRLNFYHKRTKRSIFLDNSSSSHSTRQRGVYCVQCYFKRTRGGGPLCLLEAFSHSQPSPPPSPLSPPLPRRPLLPPVSATPLLPSLPPNPPLPSRLHSPLPAPLPLCSALRHRTPRLILILNVLYPLFLLPSYLY